MPKAGSLLSAPIATVDTSIPGRQPSMALLAHSRAQARLLCASVANPAPVLVSILCPLKSRSYRAIMPLGERRVPSMSASDRAITLPNPDSGMWHSGCTATSCPRADLAPLGERAHPLTAADYLDGTAKYPDR
jgi:hypothetical protein